ncbi:zinc finger protein with KRAB and SCAN domains 5-like isoform X2 [Varroa jacobsoni]|nr:zinc finger protein with KRAB and SCAN domains 5-like isoform X2 [Varroa jacobsoni]
MTDFVCGIVEDDAPTASDEDQAEDEANDFDIVFEASAMGDTTCSAIKIKQESKEELVDEVLSEAPYQTVTQAALTTIGPSILDTQSGQSDQPVRLVVIKKERCSDYGPLLIKSNQKEPTSGRVLSAMPLVIVPVSPEGPALGADAKSSGGPIVTSILNSSNKVIQPVVLTGTLRQPLSTSLTVIQPRTLNEAPVATSLKVDARLLTCDQKANGTIKGVSQRKQVFPRQVKPLSTRRSQFQTSIDNASVAVTGTSSSVTTAAGQTSLVHNAQLKPVPIKVVTINSNGFRSVQYSTPKALRRQVDPNISQASANSVVLLPSRKIPIQRYPCRMMSSIASVPISNQSVTEIDVPKPVPSKTRKSFLSDCPEKLSESTLAKSLDLERIVEFEPEANVVSTPNTPSVTFTEKDEFKGLIEFEPELFDVEAESVDNTTVLDYPVARDDSERRTSKNTRRGSRKRVVQQPPAILPPPSLTPNGISQSGLVRPANGAKQRARATGEYICEFENCGKVFIRKQNLRDHWRVHTNDRPYKCNFCGKAFKQASHVIDHQRLHTKVKPFLCRVCGAGFVQAGQLNNHIRKHTTDKRRPFKCPHCPFGAAIQEAIDAHVHEAHVLPAVDNSNRSPLDCPLCIYRAVTKQDLDDHMSRHVHLRKFSCPYCEYRAHTKSRLDTHLLLHTGEKPHPCSVCGRRFRQKSQMETHCASQHQDHVKTKLSKRKMVTEDRKIGHGFDVGANDARIEVVSDEDIDVKPIILDEVIPPPK